MQQPPTHWQEILRLSACMMSAAQEARWEEMSDSAQRRDSLIRSYFVTPVTLDLALKMQDQIAELLALDEQLLGLARKEQNHVLHALKELRNGSQAIKAYHNQSPA